MRLNYLLWNSITFSDYPIAENFDFHIRFLVLFLLLFSSLLIHKLFFWSVLISFSIYRHSCSRSPAVIRLSDLASSILICTSFIGLSIVLHYASYIWSSLTFSSILISFKSFFSLISKLLCLRFIWLFSFNDPFPSFKLIHKSITFNCYSSLYINIFKFTSPCASTLLR